jgi:small subunit ribosomal protein S7
VPRKGHTPKREVAPDPVYNSELVSRFVNKVMLKGKKGLAQRTFYGALDSIGEKTGKNPLEVFEQAVKNVMPLLEVRPRRVGGATYQVPMEVRADRRLALAIRWLVGYARDRGERTMQDRLAAELMEAAGGTGASVKKREEVHRMAEANKPFAHYRW